MALRTNGGSALAPSLDISAPQASELSASGRLVIWIAVLSVLFLSQIALNIGEFPVSLPLVCCGCIPLYVVFSRCASLDIMTLALLVVMIGLASFRISLATALVSWTSLLLLAVLYAPFAIRLAIDQNLLSVQRYVQAVFVSGVTMIAIIAVIQLVLVNAGVSLLANIYFVLPESIRGAGTYAFVRESGGIIKANGFFLREASGLSVVTALAMLIEYRSRARLSVLGILAAGLISSLSGSGVLAIVAGTLLPKNIVRVPLFLLSFLVLAIVLTLLYRAEIPGLSIWFDRFSEFETPNTSGYARFVAPFEMVTKTLNDGGLTTLLGAGGGSYLREAALLGVKYEINDPTWAKLIFEYGILGFLLVLLIFIFRVYSSALPIEVCHFLLFSWLTSGSVLKPDFVLFVWLLTMVASRSGEFRFSSFTHSSSVEGSGR